MGTAVTSAWRETRLPVRRDAQARRTVRVRAGDLGVGGHPVVRCGLALLRGEQRQDRGERVDREALAGRKVQHLAPELEEVAGLRAAIEPRAGRGDDLDPEVVELEAVVWRVRHEPPLRGIGRHGYGFRGAGLCDRVRSPPHGPAARPCSTADALTRIVRRQPRGRRRLVHRRARHDHRAHRPERGRQDHPVQLPRRRASPDERTPPLRGRAHRRAAPGPDLPPRPRPHLPDPAAVPGR